jgi:hypothetical protein
MTKAKLRLGSFVLRLFEDAMKFPFFKREPTTLRERLLAALEQAEKAEKVFFVPLGEGFYVYVMPPVYDFAEERDRFNQEAEEARQSVMGDAPLGRYTLINFRDVREGRFPYSDDYQQWADKYAIKLTGQIGLIFMVMANEVRQVIAQECERVRLTCEPQGEWDMVIPGSPKAHTIYVGDLVYEAIGRATELSELVQEQLANL